MAKTTAEQLTPGQKIIQGLTEFRDALASGDDLAERFTVRTVTIPEPPTFSGREVAELRHKMNASQSVFAQLVGVSPVLERQWESGVRVPSPMACRLLHIVSKDPEAYLGNILATEPKRNRPRRQAAKA